MKHETAPRQDPNTLLTDALSRGWQTIDTIPLKGDGPFVALTLSGLIRQVHNRHLKRTARRADAYGPKRCTVVANDSGNYLAAIAWKWVEP